MAKTLKEVRSVGLAMKAVYTSKSTNGEVVKEYKLIDSEGKQVGSEIFKAVSAIDMKTGLRQVTLLDGTKKYCDLMGNLYDQPSSVARTDDKKSIQITLPQIMCDYAFGKTGAYKTAVALNELDAANQAVVNFIDLFNKNLLLAGKKVAKAGADKEESASEIPVGKKKVFASGMFEKWATKQQEEEAERQKQEKLAKEKAQKEVEEKNIKDNEVRRDAGEKYIEEYLTNKSFVTDIEPDKGYAFVVKGEPKQAFKMAYGDLDFVNKNGRVIASQDGKTYKIYDKNGDSTTESYEMVGQPSADRCLIKRNDGTYQFFDYNDNKFGLSYFSAKPYETDSTSENFGFAKTVENKDDDELYTDLLGKSTKNPTEVGRALMTYLLDVGKDEKTIKLDLVDLLVKADMDENYDRAEALNFVKKVNADYFRKAVDAATVEGSEAEIGSRLDAITESIKTRSKLVENAGKSADTAAQEREEFKGKSKDKQTSLKDQAAAIENLIEESFSL